jgi:hypothetical protein
MVPEDLPVAEFAFPGPLRDQLVAAVLDGTKTTTTGLVANYEHEGSPLPRPGLREAVVDSAGNRVAVIEITAVRVVRLAEVDLAHALGEGEPTAARITRPRLRRCSRSARASGRTGCRTSPTRSPAAASPGPR